MSRKGRRLPAVVPFSATAKWSGTGGRRRLGGARHVRRSPVTLLGLLATLSPACLLDPLPIGPGDEAADEIGSEADAEADASSGESDASTSSEPDTDTSSESGTDTSSSSESESDSEGDGDTSATDETATDETDTDTGDGDCQPTFAEGQGACETLLGYAWTGSGCEALEGCSCDGPDCPEVFETPLECWLANQSCAPSPCAGLDELSCMSSAPLCAPRMARPVLTVIDQLCLSETVFVGCGLALTCAQVISYACPLGQPDAVHEFASACLPELDWVACEPPLDQLEPC